MILTLLLRYWKFAAGAAGMAVVALLLHNVSLAWTKASYERKIENARAEEVAACERDKNLTKEVSSDYQKQISALNSRIADLKRVRPSVCIPVANPAARCDGTAVIGGHAGANGQGGVTSDFLYDFAGEAETYRLRLIACQSFISKTWASRGQ